MFLAIPLPPQPIEVKTPCVPTPCGPNSQCRDIGGNAVCSCLPGNIGSPPNCRPECTVNSECPSNMACMNQKCRDPCPGSCGIQATCQVRNHSPVCVCPPGYVGDAFVACTPKPIPRKNVVKPIYEHILNPKSNFSNFSKGCLRSQPMRY